MDEHREAVEGALRATDAFMTALNARDEAALNAALHFPHVRIASGGVHVWEKPGDYRMDAFLARAGDGWDSSRWDFRTPLHADPDKVHLDVQFTRLRADGSAIGAFRSLWVVAHIGGRWAIQARSSFAS